MVFEVLIHNLHAKITSRGDEAAPGESMKLAGDIDTTNQILIAFDVGIGQFPSQLCPYP